MIIDKIFFLIYVKTLKRLKTQIKIYFESNFSPSCRLNVLSKAGRRCEGHATGSFQGH